MMKSSRVRARDARHGTRTASVETTTAALEDIDTNIEALEQELKAKRKERTRLKDQRDRLASAAAREALDKRCATFGQAASAVGLFTLDDTILSQLLTTLAPLVEVPDPVALLELAIAEILDGVASTAPSKETPLP